MSKRDDYEKIIRETPLNERLDKCQEAIGKMCAEGRPPKMTIPAQYYDEDIYISTTLMDAKAELKKRQWIPVTERLPEQGDDVLVLWEGDMIVMYINRHGNWAFTLDSEELETGEVAHWMPLPEPPKDGV